MTQSKLNQIYIYNNMKILLSEMLNFNRNNRLDLNELSKKITISRIAGLLDCSTRTIHRNMSEELKREKELLYKQL